MAIDFDAVKKQIGEEGKTGSFPKDYAFEYVVKIPPKAAIEIVRRIVPKTMMGRHELAANITMENVEDQWLNHLFVVIEVKSNKIVALYKSDYRFFIMQRLR